MRKSRIGISVICAICMIVITGSIFSGRHISDNIKESNNSNDTSLSSAKIEFKNDTPKLRGTLFDRNFKPLSYTAYKRDPQEFERKYCDTPETKLYALPMSNLIDGYSSQKEGLDLVYEQLLRTSNSTSTVDDEIGQSVRLSIDAELTRKVYDVLFELNASEMNASVVIMKPNGEVLTMLSTPTFDLEEYKTSQTLRVSLTQSEAVKNSCRHLIEIDPYVFSDACGIISDGTIGDVGYNKFSRMLNETFLFSSSIFDEKLFGKCENGRITMKDDGTVKAYTTPLYLCQYMNLCINGQFTKPQILMDTVDTNVPDKTIENYFTSENLSTLSKDKVSRFREVYAEINNIYNFNINDNFSLYGTVSYYGNTELICGAYVNNDPEKTYLITLYIDNNDFKGIYNNDEFYSLFDRILTLLS